MKALNDPNGLAYLNANKEFKQNVKIVEDYLKSRNKS